MDNLQGSEEANGTIEKFEQDTSNILPFQLPTVLYHYCSCKTFESIINSGVLRNSHIQDMNDRLEFAHGMHMFANALGSLKRKGITGAFIEAMKAKIENEARDPKTAPFVFCLTPNKNQKSQWESY